MFVTLLQHHNVIQDRRYDFRLNSICEVQFFPQGLLQAFGVNLRRFLQLLLLTQGHPLFLQGGDLAVESSVALLEFLERNGVSYTQFQQLILFLLNLTDLHLNSPNLSRIVHLAGGFPNAVKHQLDNLLFLCDHLLKEVS